MPPEASRTPQVQTPHLSQASSSKSSKNRKSVGDKYPMIYGAENPSCLCKMKCVETIPLERQQQIHKAFWQMETRDERLQWIFAMIEQNEVHSHRAIKSRTATKNRNITRVYRFLVEGVYKVVCKKFFLSTLGYKHDAILTNLFKAMTPSKIRPLNDRRGKHTPKHALSLWS